jgi:hypothetical protein
MRRALLVALVIAALAAAGAIAPSAPAKTRSCAAVGYYGISYPVRIERGTVSCKTARLTLRRFLVNGVSPKGWHCFRGHSGNNYAAACARGSRTLIRALNPR